jgi:predicted nucleotidyltransferase
MNASSPEQQAVFQRFTEACEEDERVVAAFFGGSLVTEKADEWSDLDIYLITTDDGYDSFFAERKAFVHGLGEPVFLEDFNDFGFDMVLFTFADGVEGELALAKESRFEHIHGGPFKALVDKKGVLAGKTFPLYQPSEDDQQRALRQVIYSFWESLSYFIKAMHRRQLWTSYGSLDEMRMKCLKLARLQRDFTTEQTAYSKAEQVLSEEELLRLQPTCSSLEAEAMLEAALILLKVYREIAPGMAAKHKITYPVELEHVIVGRLETLHHSV